MTTPTKPATTTQRVAALRARRSREGLVRLEVYARVEDHEAIKAYAAELAERKRKKNLDVW